MFATFTSLRKTTIVLPALAVLLGAPSSAKADTVLSGFEGDLSSVIGANWMFYDASADPGDQIWPHSFVTNGVTEGTQALQITHFTGWTHGFSLIPTSDAERDALIDLFATHDTLEFDLTTGPATSWRQLFFIVNSSETGWSQVQIDIPANATTHFALPLTNPDPSDATKNWKQSAIDGAGTATYWEIVFALQGADLAATADFDFDLDADGADFLIWQRNVGNMSAGTEHGDANFDGIVNEIDLEAWEQEFGRSNQFISTTIDNIQFTNTASAIAAVPEPSGIAVGTLGVLLLSAAAVPRCMGGRRRRGEGDR